MTHCESEWATLRRVVTASPAAFFQTPPINLTQELEYSARPIDIDRLLGEYRAVIHILRKVNTSIVEVPPRADLPYLFNTRDAGVALGDRYLQCKMAKAIRADEPNWIAHHVIGDRPQTLQPSKSVDASYEGGDIFIIDGVLVVGISQRTNVQGVELLLRRSESKRQVFLVELTPDVLHLDTVFNVVPGICVADSDRIVNFDALTEELARWGIGAVVEVSHAEANGLATNFLCLAKDHILIADSAPELKEELERRGVIVDVVTMTEHHRIGGSVRCMTLPLVRDDP